MLAPGPPGAAIGPWGTAVRVRHNAGMQTIDFELDREYVALNDLLHLAGIAGTGGMGKAIVASGDVFVDGVQELRKTAKIRAGQVVRQHVLVEGGQLGCGSCLAGERTCGLTVVETGGGQCLLGGSVAFGDVGDTLRQRIHHRGVRNDVDEKAER